MQSAHEGRQRGDFRRTQVLAVSRHVAAALNHLAHQLIPGQACGDTIEHWSAQPSFATYAVAVDALLIVENQSALPLEW